MKYRRADRRCLGVLLCQAALFNTVVNIALICQADGTADILDKQCSKLRFKIRNNGELKSAHSPLSF